MGGGIIASGYKGPIRVVLFNHLTKYLQINEGDRIAQLIFQKIAHCIKLIEVKDFDDKTDRVSNQVCQSVSNETAVNKYVPDYISPDLKWYERDGLLTYIDQLKHSEFSKDLNSYLKNAKVVNFEITHAQCRGDTRKFDDKYYQTVFESSVKNMPQK